MILINKKKYAMVWDNIIISRKDAILKSETKKYSSKRI